MLSLKQSPDCSEKRQKFHQNNDIELLEVHNSIKNRNGTFQSFDSYLGSLYTEYNDMINNAVKATTQVFYDRKWVVKVHMKMHMNVEQKFQFHHKTKKWNYFQ